MTHIARIEQELDSFPETLTLYREQLKRWFNQKADQASRAADMPSLMGMERLIKLGSTTTAVSSGDDGFFSSVAQCPDGGILEIESKFESVYDIPLGNISVDVIAMDGGETTPVKLDENGKGQFVGTPGKFYRVHVQSEVTPAQIEDLFFSYDGLTKELDGWLRCEWAGFKPQWSQSTFVAAGNGLLAGSWKAIVGVWDSISLLSDILQNPRKFVGRLGSGAEQLATLAKDFPATMAKVQLLVSDEAALCLLLRTASLWLDMLPASEIAGKTAEVASTLVVQLLIDLLIGIVLTFAGAGAGIAYLGLRLAHHGARFVSAVTGFIKAIFTILDRFMTYVDRYKTVAARGVAAGLKQGRMQLRWDAKRNTTLKQNEHHDNAPDQAKNPNGDSADSANKTATNKCPVSMVTGEELLTLSDGSLDGVLPFDFTRLYRTSAADIDSGLGFGWSHSLSHRLDIDGASVIWTDHENRRTTFPLPSAERPTIHNCLSRAAIYLGNEPEELILAQAGDEARFYHFHHGRLTAISDAYDSRRLNADGTQLKYRYDNAQLLLTEIENESGEQYRLDYTPGGLIRQETGFDGQRTAYAYDLNGQLLEKTEFGADGSQLITAYERDSAGRLLVKTLPDGIKVKYRYDNLGRLISVDDGHDHPLEFEYDQQDRLITEHQGWGTLRYGYDACGQLKRLRLPDGSKLDYHHAKGGALTAIDLNGARLTTHQFAFGREQQRQQGQLTSHYHYDEQGRLQTHAIHQQTRPRYMRHYGYAVNGNLATVADSRHGQRSYYYDPLNRLARVRHTRDDPAETFSHDPAGNLLMQDRPGAAKVRGNRLLLQGDRHYDYDAFGNLIRERRGTAQKLVTDYRYDCQHRLIGITTPDGRTASYRYDAFGRRIAKTVNGHTTEFFWQGDNLVAESSREHYRSYVYEPGSFRPLAMLDGKGPRKACPFYYQLDHLGTPQELTDFGGEIVWSAKYNAYGKVTHLALGGGEQLEQPLRFQGQYFDTESGLHYNRHRYYDPDVGRYLTQDPVKLAGGLNPYQYTPNPTGWVDPLGLSGNCPPPNKPGCGAPDDTTGARVDEGEPALPKLKLSAQELAEKEVRRLDKSQGMHMVGKHSPAVPDAKWKQRAIDGTDPITGRKPWHQRGNPSSRFSSWELMLEAYTLATTRTKNGLPRYTGKDNEDNDVVRMRLPGAGEGYMPNSKSKENPKLIGLDGFEMKFDDDGVPFTLYPIK